MKSRRHPAQKALTVKPANATATEKRDAANFDRVCSEGKKLKPPVRKSRV